MILPVYKEIIISNPKIVDIIGVTGIYIDKIPQNAPLPHIFLEMPESGRNYTHSGVSAHRDAHLVVQCRGQDGDVVDELGELVECQLENCIRTLRDIEIMFTEHFKTMSGYDDAASVFKNVSEYTSFFRKAVR